MVPAAAAKKTEESGNKKRQSKYRMSDEPYPHIQEQYEDGREHRYNNAKDRAKRDPREYDRDVVGEYQILRKVKIE